MKLIAYGAWKKLHLQVCDQVKRMISRQGLRRGDPLPKYRQLAHDFGVSLETVRMAMKELVAEGVIHTVPRKGACVAQPVSPDGSAIGEIDLVFESSVHDLFSSTYLIMAFHGIMAEAHRLGANVRLISSRTSQPTEVREQLAEGHADGVVLLDVHDEKLLAEVAAENVPLVVVDQYYPAIPASYVACDNIAAAWQVINYLHSLGHRRIVYMDGAYPPAIPEFAKWTTDLTATTERRQGYLLAMDKLGLVDSVRVCRVEITSAEDSIFHAFGRAVGQLKADRRRATAIVVHDEGQAARLAPVLREAGFRVPEDVSVAAIAAGPDAKMEDLELTCCRIDFRKMGQESVRILEAQRAGRRPAEPEVLRVEGELVPGATAVRSDQGS